MAGLKKKKKEKSSNPNVILVIFLVLFVLTSIGLGVWGYYGYAGQAAIASDRTKQKAAADSAKITADYYSMLWRELRTTIAGEKLDQDEKAQLDVDQARFQKGEFKNEKYLEVSRQFKIDVNKSLGLPDENKIYDKNSYMDDLKAAQTKISQIEGKTNAEVELHKKTKEMLATLSKDRDKLFQDIQDRITKDNNNALAEAKKTSAEFKRVSDNNIELNAKITELGVEKGQLEEESGKKIAALTRAIKILEAEKKENLALGGPGGAPGPGGASGAKGELFPLLLDISPGKPLWDQPVGKVIRVDLDVRLVTINLGSAHGAKPELTFNIFGPNAAGRAEKQMKGTIEIIKVLDTNSSQCRITSLYDSEGIEILMNLQTRGRILRETDLPIREGDLLFNLFWGTRVAVAGYVSITGEQTKNPSEQYSQMDAFMALCKRNGMIVDAWVDMRTGKIEGNITSKTRYLIRGVDLARADDKNGAPMKKDDDKDKEMDKDKEPPKDDGVADRIATVNKANWILRNDAREKGLLLISAENFAHVVGYRKARSANSVELSGFQPRLPYAGAPQAGGVIIIPDARPKEEPKDMEKEKKDDKKDPGN